MTFLALNWLSLTITLLLVVFVVVCLLMGLLVLMQRPKQEGLGAAFGGGMTDQVFGARTTDVLQKGTIVLGSLFFIIAFTLAILLSKQDKAKSLLDDKKDVAKKVEKKSEPIVETPVEPTQPNSLSNELPVAPTPAPAVTEPVAPVTEPAPPVTEPAPPVTEPAPPIQQPK